MRRQHVGEQIRMAEGVQNARQKAHVRVVQHRHGPHDVLAAVRRGNLAHGLRGLFLGFFPQAVRQHGRPRPEHQRTRLNGAVAPERVRPVVKQRPDMQAEIFRRQIGRREKLPDAFPACLRIVFKDALHVMAGLGEDGLELLRQGGDDGLIFRHPDVLQGTLKPQDADQTAVVGHKRVPVHGFQTAVASGGTAQQLGKDLDAAIKPFNKSFKHLTNPS